MEFKRKPIEVPLQGFISLLVRKACSCEFNYEGSKFEHVFFLADRPCSFVQSFVVCYDFSSAKSDFYKKPILFMVTCCHFIIYK